MLYHIEISSKKSDGKLMMYDLDSSTYKPHKNVIKITTPATTSTTPATTSTTSALPYNIKTSMIKAKYRKSCIQGL